MIVPLAAASPRLGKNFFVLFLLFANREEKCNRKILFAARPLAPPLLLTTPDSRVTSFEATTTKSIGTIPEEYDEEYDAEAVADDDDGDGDDYDDEGDATLRRAFASRCTREEGDFISIDRVCEHKKRSNKKRPCF